MIWVKSILAGVLVPPLLGSIYYFFLSYGSGTPFNQTVYLITIFFSYWLVTLVGVPAILAFKSQQAIPLKRSVLTGVFVALVVVFLLFSFSALLPPLSQLVIFSLLGAIAGLVVWCIFK